MNHMRKGVVRNAENKRQFVNLLLILLAIICSNHRRHFEVQITHLTPSTLGSEILPCIQFLQGMLSQFLSLISLLPILGFVLNLML